MKNSLATTIVAFTLVTTSVCLSAHASGIFTISYFDHDDEDEKNEQQLALDTSTAGVFTFAPEASETNIQPASKQPQNNKYAENEKLYEEIYLSQLYEELQLMNDYDELLTALSIEEAKKSLQEQQTKLQHDHDYHELMGAYSYHLEYDRLVDHFAFVQFTSDYDELMDALAAQDIDPKTFDIKFSDSTVEDEVTGEPEKFDFAKLRPEQQAELQEQMEHGELAEVDRVIRASK